MSPMKLLLVLLLASCSVLQAFAAKQYSYFRVGNPNDVTTATTAGTMLEGGGTDVDAAYQWMCQRSGNGDFLVIRCHRHRCLQSLYSAALPERKFRGHADHSQQDRRERSLRLPRPFRTRRLFSLRGEIKPTTSISGRALRSRLPLNTLIARGVPIGGTSAGMNVLSQFVYTALGSQGVTSSEALANPYNKYITLGENFVNISISAGTH